MRRIGIRHAIVRRCAVVALLGFALGGCSEDLFTRVRARVGDSGAQYLLSQRLLAKGSEEQVAEGMEWLARAAEGGVAPAQAQLARAYASGEGVAADAALARSWL